jgi:hypothetical protein
MASLLSEREDVPTAPSKQWCAKVSLAEYRREGILETQRELFLLGQYLGRQKLDNNPSASKSSGKTLLLPPILGGWTFTFFVCTVLTVCLFSDFPKTETTEALLSYSCESFGFCNISIPAVSGQLAVVSSYAPWVCFVSSSRDNDRQRQLRND